ncbi:4508_t:CDS:2 [Dentiscutata erythropus]|uniref:4508_t:CDS:1 n=1 Tax=Dentiscutata erythropus TaxID=1348616 RepID=A0A9N9HRF6_9GLOM|nr:4508_t:CDS:2 [Dentiscutata erythropus]
MIFLEEDSDESSNSCFKWYTSAWKRKIPEYKYNENNSDANSEIDEIQELIKLKKEKLKSPSAKCLYDWLKMLIFGKRKLSRIFMATSPIKFLGYIVKKEGISIDPQKVEADFWD